MTALRQLREWFEETHGADFELVRHFILRFFDSDLVTTPGQWSTMLILNVPYLVLPIFLLVPALMRKYRHFSALSSPEPYRHAVLGDQLWLVVLSMSLIGLLTALKWQSLFPDLRDYLTLGVLPVRPRQIFFAKLLALLAVASAAIVAVTLLPTFMFPISSASRWRVNQSMGAHILAHGLTCVLASLFFFFALVACQGLLLNLLPPRPFALLASYLQGLLITAMLTFAVLSFSIDARTVAMLIRPETARWLPPMWFFGLYQTLLGDGSPVYHALAATALAALPIAIVATAVLYILSYRRHRVLMVESAVRRRRDRGFAAVILDALLREPRRQAIFHFLLKTLFHSSQHRMMLMGYFGFALALTLSGIAGIAALAPPGRRVAASFVYGHLVVMTLILIGMRHLFSVPAELRANWIFQMVEREGRREWLGAVDTFLLGWAAFLVLLVPFPLEGMLLGWQAVAECALFAAVLLLAYEFVFMEWNKLPFTCSYLPGNTPGPIVLAAFVGISAVLPVLTAILVSTLDNIIGWVMVMFLLMTFWTWAHHTRRIALGDVRLKYEEAPEPTVQCLNLGTN